MHVTLHKIRVPYLRSDIYRIFEQWIDNQVNYYAEALHDYVTPPMPDEATFHDISILHHYESIEKEYLLLECTRYFEVVLILCIVEWDKAVKTHHGEMVERMLAYSPAENQRTEKTCQKLKTRLTDELEFFLDQEAVTRTNNMRTRITAHRAALDEGSLRIPGLSLRYDDTGSALVLLRAAWEDMLRELLNALKFPVRDANSAAASYLAADPSSGTQPEEDVNHGSSTIPSLMLDSADLKTHMQKSFEEGIQNRFLKSSFNDSSKYSSTHEFHSKRDMADGMMARCRTRASRLAEMLATGKVNVRHLSESGSFLTVENPFENQRFKDVLTDSSEEWKKRVSKSENGVSRSDY